MTELESQLQSSITYRRLINDIEAIGNRWASESELSGVIRFTPEARVEMTRLIADTVGNAIKDYVHRCAECDKRIDPICEECAS